MRSDSAVSPEKHPGLTEFFWIKDHLHGIVNKNVGERDFRVAQGYSISEGAINMRVSAHAGCQNGGFGHFSAVFRGNMEGKVGFCLGVRCIDNRF